MIGEAGEKTTDEDRTCVKQSICVLLPVVFDSGCIVEPIL